MRCHVLVAAATTAVMCLAPTAVRAEPIVITSGTAQTGGDVSFVNIRGTDGFSATAALRFGNTCLSTFCIAEEGDPIPISGLWFGSELGGGTVMLNGVTYTNIGAVDSMDILSLEFFGRPQRAPAVRPGPLTLQAPFRFEGSFRHGGFSEEHPPFARDIVGQGVATLTIFGVLQPHSVDLWTSNDIRWDFTDPRAVPEPALLSLVGLGVASAWNRARRRRDTARGHRAAAEILAIR